MTIRLKSMESRPKFYNQTRFLTLIKGDKTTSPVIHRYVCNREFNTEAFIGRTISLGFKSLRHSLSEAGMNLVSIDTIEDLFVRSNICKNLPGKATDLLKMAIIFVYTVNSTLINGGSVRGIVNELSPIQYTKSSWFVMLAYALSFLEPAEEPNETKSFYVLGEYDTELCSGGKRIIFPSFVTAYRSVADVYAQAYRLPSSKVAVFQISGKCVGYDISAFSSGFLPENMILLLPEQTFTIKRVNDDRHLKGVKRVELEAVNIPEWTRFMSGCFDKLKMVPSLGGFEGLDSKILPTKAREIFSMDLPLINLEGGIPVPPSFPAYQNQDPLQYSFYSNDFPPIPVPPPPQQQQQQQQQSHESPQNSLQPDFFYSKQFIQKQLETQELLQKSLQGSYQSSPQQSNYETQCNYLQCSPQQSNYQMPKSSSMPPHQKFQQQNPYQGNFQPKFSRSYGEQIQPRPIVCNSPPPFRQEGYSQQSSGLYQGSSQPFECQNLFFRPSIQQNSWHSTGVSSPYPQQNCSQGQSSYGAHTQSCGFKTPHSQPQTQYNYSCPQTQNFYQKPFLPPPPPPSPPFQCQRQRQQQQQQQQYPFQFPPTQPPSQQDCNYPQRQFYF